MSESTTVRIERCLGRLRGGDQTARTELLELAHQRLLHLTRKMLQGSRQLKRWEESDDVFQSAVMRLWKTLEKVQPESVRHFFRLAAVQVRRELIDLARHYYGPEGSAAHHHSHGDNTPAPAVDPGASTLDPVAVATWTDFHTQIDALPDEQREVFELLWYQGLSHEQAAELLGVATKTVQRRFRDAKIALHEALGGAPPGL